MEAAGQLMSLKEENDSLKCQLEAYINEAEMVKLESKQNVDALEKQIKSLQNALKGMQQVRVSRSGLYAENTPRAGSCCFVDREYKMQLKKNF